MVKRFINKEISPADFEFLVSKATKAPSGHNTQPWRFRQSESAVEIHPDFDRRLPVVDPHDRELFVSCGCATEMRELPRRAKEVTICP